jgi:cytochrome c553
MARRARVTAHVFPASRASRRSSSIDRLHEFQARARANTPQAGTMTAVAATMDDEQIAEAAAYLSQLAPFRP